VQRCEERRSLVEDVARPRVLVDQVNTVQQDPTALTIDKSLALYFGLWTNDR
jgi:hypothetical protein